MEIHTVLKIKFPGAALSFFLFSSSLNTPKYFTSHVAPFRVAFLKGDLDSSSIPLFPIYLGKK